jgi:hypothetical protein
VSTPPIEATVASAPEPSPATNDSNEKFMIFPRKFENKI